MKLRNKKRRLLSESLEARHLLAGPYAPAAGEIGSDAIAHDDVAIVAWASRVENYAAGSDVEIEFQTPANALGPAETGLPDTVSLGRGGSLTLAFDAPIRDGLGADFAVFENSFSDTFLELGYVEVSSDGVNFVRFASDSLTPASVDAFGSVDPTEINNLAGKYRAGFGTPFDLEELVGNAELDTTQITHVRLVDVVGDGSSADSGGDTIFDPFPTVGSAGLDVDAVGVIHQAQFQLEVAGFEDVGASLAASSSFSGPDPNGTTAPGTFGGTTTTGMFNSETLGLNNAYNDQFGSWTGFAFSNVTDNTTAGFLNQYGSFAGGGASGSSTFAVGFADVNGNSPLPTITRDPMDRRRLHSLAITNTTYAALSMTNGDQFAKKFGGDSGNDPDFLLLTIDGQDAAGASVGTVEFYLADFRFTDNSMDYIVDQWTEVDLSSIADARSLVFTIDSSDVGAFGVNTPAYFALDDITFAKQALAVDIADREVSEADGDMATTVRVSRPVADTTQPIVVSLSPVDEAIATVPASVTIAAGQRFVEFPVGVVNDELAGATQSIQLEAAADGFGDGEVSLAILDDDVRGLTLSLAAVNDTAVNEGESFDLTVSRNDANLSSPLTVQLSTDAAILNAASTVVIPANAASATIAVSALDDDTAGENQSTVIAASAAEYTGSEVSVQVIDNDQAAVRLAYSGDPLTESTAATEAGFEDVGTTLPNESFYNGSDLAGGFASAGLQFNTSFNATFGSWSGWAYSNTTDTTTAGFTNQYSAFTGAGAGGSDTYAVASTFSLPTIVRDANDGEFDSIEITNTTYAALSMQQGDSFAKKFGGESGDDEDFFLLTITGRNAAGESTGTIDFYLADFRFADNSLDYIVDEWTSIDLTPLTDALSLEFSLSSSDVGQFGMNTPAYFAADNVTLADSQSATAVVSRNSEDISEALTVTLQSDDPSELVVPSMVVIPAGESSAEVLLRVRDDLIVDGTQAVTVTVASVGFSGGSTVLSVDDDDVAALTLTALDSEVGEGQQGRLFVHRNVDDVSTALDLTFGSTGEITLPTSAVIPAGSRTAEVFWVADDNAEIDADRDATITVQASGFESSQTEVRIINDDFPPPALTLELDGSTLSESDAPTTISLEDIGAIIADGSFDNGANGAGGFVSGSLSLNNSFNPQFGSWGGWSVSKTTDTTTAGFTNQYSSIDGGGAVGSETYAVASAFPGGFVPTLTLDGVDPSQSFQSLQITNTTYAALSMRDGDSFAKKFGGESGDDPDFFLLKIEGVDAAGESVGVVDVYLADYRFDDNSLDYILDSWTPVDVSSLADASELKFSLSSSDVGDFGMNTPAYFAVDEVVVSDAPGNVVIATVTRNDRDLSSELVVDLTSNPDGSVSHPSTVTIPSGSASATVAILAIDNAIFGGDQMADVSVTSPTHASDSQSLIVTENDEPTLTVTAENAAVSEASSLEILVHRNTANLSIPLTINLDSQQSTFAGELQFPSTATIPVGARSTVVSVSAADDFRAQGDRNETLQVTASGFASMPVDLTIIDDDAIALVVEQTNDQTVVGQPEQSDQLSVRLAAEPESDVLIAVSPASAKILTNQTQLRFTPDDWDVPQLVDLTSRFDFEVENEFFADLTFGIVLEGSDPGFAGLADVSVPVGVEDFQPASVRLSETEFGLRLTDEDSQARLLQVDGRDGFSLVANSAAQTVTIDPLTRTRGLVQIDTAGGDDTVIIRGTRFTSLDGGAGYDRLVVDLNRPVVDLVELFANRTARFEEYVIAGNEPAQLMVDSQAAASLANDDGQLVLQLSPSQQLSLTGEVVLQSPQMVRGQFAQVVSLGDITIQVVSQTPHRNVVNVFDVDQSGVVTPADILSVINRISEGPATLDSLTSVENFDGRYVDVSGDGVLTPNDILEVINHLAEAASLPTSDPVSGDAQGEFLMTSTLDSIDPERDWLQENDMAFAALERGSFGSGSQPLANVDHVLEVLFATELDDEESVPGSAESHDGSLTGTEISTDLKG